MPIEFVLFDHDETLLSTHLVRSRTLERTAAEVIGRKIDGAALLDESNGQSLEQMMLGLAEGDETLALHLVETYRSRYYLENDAISVFDGVRETLAALDERGIPMAVVTSKLGRGARIELERVGLIGHFSVLVGSEDVANPKPHPEPLVTAMEAIGAHAGRTIMIGDTAADLLGARAAGIQSALACWGARDAAVLEQIGPDYSLARPQDLLSIV